MHPIGEMAGLAVDRMFKVMFGVILFVGITCSALTYCTMQSRQADHDFMVKCDASHGKARLADGHLVCLKPDAEIKVQ